MFLITTHLHESDSHGQASHDVEVPVNPGLERFNTPRRPNLVLGVVLKKGHILGYYGARRSSLLPLNTVTAHDIYEAALKVINNHNMRETVLVLSLF